MLKDKKQGSLPR